MRTTFAVIVGNRGFFPDALVKGTRRTIIDLLKKAGYGVVTAGTREIKHGAVETFEEAKRCAALSTV